jgi:hypothetical protein
MDSPSAMMDPDCVVDLIFLEFDDEDGVRAAKKGRGDADDEEEEEGEEVATTGSTSATLSTFFILFFLATSSSNCLALRS